MSVLKAGSGIPLSSTIQRSDLSKADADISLKTRLRRALYASGGLGLWHYFYGSDALTVVMFHRVLPAAELAGRDQQYTVSTDQFATCLEFFGRHYSPVSLAQVEGAIDGGQLPPRALLITFDDGWHDTLKYAAPLLRAAGLPAVCFLPSNVLDGEAWWPARFNECWRQGPNIETHVEDLWNRRSPYGGKGRSWPGVEPYIRCLLMLNEIHQAARDAFLADFAPKAGFSQYPMLTREDAAALVDYGIAIGAHGASHLPLDLVRDLKSELVTARAILETVIAGTPQKRVTALSFPHGRFNAAVLIESRKAGYKALFSSGATIARMGRGGLDGLFGRLEIAEACYFDPSGNFEPDRLASRLFRLPATGQQALPHRAA